MEYYKIRALFIIIVFWACNTSTHSDKQSGNAIEPINNFFTDWDLGSSGSKTRLLLNARFSECGEWGGHNEKMVVYAKADREFYLDYQKFKVNCDSIGKYYGTSSFQKLEFEKTIKLNQSNKESISNYIQRMIKSKVGERFPGHTGNSFTILKSDSTLLIEVYDDKEYDLMSYNKLQTELKLPKTKVFRN